MTNLTESVGNTNRNGIVFTGVVCLPRTEPVKNVLVVRGNDCPFIVLRWTVQGSRVECDDDSNQFGDRNLQIAVRVSGDRVFFPIHKNAASGPVPPYSSEPKIKYVVGRVFPD